MDTQDRYVKREEICRAGTKTVFKAIDRSLGSIVALFEWDFSQLSSSTREQEINKFISRLKLVSQIESEYLLAMVSDTETPFFVNPETQSSVIGFGELMGITLKGFLQKAGGVSVATINDWAFQILKGLEFLHSRSPAVILRNLKLENIFYDAKAARLKIGDLCDAKILKSKLPKRKRGETNRMAPEMLLQSFYDSKVDIWAFGLCLIEMATVMEPYNEFDGSKEKTEAAIVNGLLPHALARIHEPIMMVNIIGLCLRYEGTLRPTATQLLESQFLKTVPAQRDLFVTLHEFNEVETRGLFERTRTQWETLYSQRPEASKSRPQSPALTPTPNSPLQTSPRQDDIPPVVSDNNKSNNSDVKDDVVLDETDFFPPVSTGTPPNPGRAALTSSQQRPRGHSTSSGSVPMSTTPTTSPGSTPGSVRSNITTHRKIKTGDVLLDSHDLSRSPDVERNVYQEAFTRPKNGTVKPYESPNSRANIEPDQILVLSPTERDQPPRGTQQNSDEVLEATPKPMTHNRPPFIQTDEVIILQTEHKEFPVKDYLATKENNYSTPKDQITPNHRTPSSEYSRQDQLSQHHRIPSQDQSVVIPKIQSVQHTTFMSSDQVIPLSSPNSRNRAEENSRLQDSPMLQPPVRTPRRTSCSVPPDDQVLIFKTSDEKKPEAHEDQVLLFKKSTEAETASEGDSSLTQKHSDECLIMVEKKPEDVVVHVTKHASARRPPVHLIYTDGTKTQSGTRVDRSSSQTKEKDQPSQDFPEEGFRPQTPRSPHPPESPDYFGTSPVQFSIIPEQGPKNKSLPSQLKKTSKPPQFSASDPTRLPSGRAQASELFLSPRSRANPESSTPPSVESSSFKDSRSFINVMNGNSMNQPQTPMTPPISPNPSPPPWPSTPPHTHSRQHPQDPSNWQTSTPPPALPVQISPPVPANSPAHGVPPVAGLVNSAPPVSGPVSPGPSPDDEDLWTKKFNSQLQSLAAGRSPSQNFRSS